MRTKDFAYRVRMDDTVGQSHRLRNNMMDLDQWCQIFVSKFPNPCHYIQQLDVYNHEPHWIFFFTTEEDAAHLASVWPA